MANVQSFLLALLAFFFQSALTSPVDSSASGAKPDAPRNTASSILVNILPTAVSGSGVVPSDLTSSILSIVAPSAPASPASSIVSSILPSNVSGTVVLPSHIAAGLSPIILPPGLPDPAHIATGLEVVANASKLLTYNDQTYNLSTLSHQLMNPSQITNLTLNSTIQVRTFNPATLKDFYCFLPWFGAAPQYAVDEVIAQELAGETVEEFDTLNLAFVWPHNCLRVSCWMNTAVTVCNDRDDMIAVFVIDVGNYAMWIRYHCNANGWIMGQLFDLGDWNVIVASNSCQ